MVMAIAKSAAQCKAMPNNPEQCHAMQSNQTQSRTQRRKTGASQQRDDMQGGAINVPPAWASARVWPWPQARAEAEKPGGDLRQGLGRGP
eukprot:5435878-Pyramimonas_sp.AAC.1